MIFLVIKGYINSLKELIQTQLKDFFHIKMQNKKLYHIFVHIKLLNLSSEATLYIYFVWTVWQ